MKNLSPVTLRFVEGASDKQYSVQIVANGDGFNVVAAWGRTGSSQQSAVKNADPLSIEKAQALADKLLGEKRRKGYSDAEGGASYSGVEFAGRDSGLRVQLLEPVSEGQSERLMADPAWGLQLKLDGERRLLIIEPGEDAIGTNRNGLLVGISSELARLAASIPVTGKTVIDGEDLGHVFAPFDILMQDGNDLRALPYSDRLRRLERLITDCPDVPKPTTFLGSTEKRAGYDAFRRQGVEGVVWKLMSAPSTPGRCGKSSTQFKDKFVESATCRVIARNGDKRSVALELMDAATGIWRGVGNCTIPSSYPIPEAASLVEIGYLYLVSADGCLVQPTYKGVRKDVAVSDCTTAQLKLKAPSAPAQAA